MSKDSSQPAWATCPYCNKPIVLVLHKEQKQDTEQKRLPKASTSRGFEDAMKPHLNAVTLTRMEDTWVIFTKGWLGADGWGRVHETIKAFDGVWIKDGKQSHWEVPIYED